MAGTDKRYIDPMFYIPDGMSDTVWAYRENAPTDIDTEDTALDEVAGGFEDGFADVDSDVTLVDESDASSDDAPMFIDNLSVVSQVLRRAADGSMVVDMVVEVDNIPGITKYEFRVTKV